MHPTLRLSRAFLSRAGRQATCAAALSAAVASAHGAEWDGYAGNAQHSALSTVASQSLDSIHWQTSVDIAPQYTGSELLIHYGSPVITPGNTIIVPVKTGTWDGFELQGINAATGVLLWTQPTDYTLPPQGQGAAYSWTPSYSPALATSNTLYYAGAGGTVYERSTLDSPGSVTPTQMAFYGSLSTYQANEAAYNAGVAISTPITADAQGNIYFGYQTTNSAPGGLTNGIARISSTGVGTFFEASQLLVDGSSAGMTQVVTNSAPAVSPTGSTVYVAMSSGNYSTGRLVALNAATLTPTASVALIDPQTLSGALLPNDGTASPMIGPDGDVYMGVYDDANTSRGFMEHYSANLALTKPTGAFGWDDTASIVPASMVPSYHGTSTYLIMTKYNNYAETGGHGDNRLAILDPNATQVDNRINSTGATVMQEILTIKGLTPDPAWVSQFPGAVDEWCINTAVVDPATDSILVNSEDGRLYRWNLATNTLTQVITLSGGLGEAYTPTLMGPDGTVYAISNATLFAVGAAQLGPNYTWAGSTNSNWTTLASDINWTSSGASAWSNNPTRSTPNSVTFNLATPINVTVNGTIDVGMITFATGGWVLTAGTGTLAYGATGTINISVTTPTAVATINAAIADGSTFGSGGGVTSITKSGPGTLILGGANSYTGGTILNDGTLLVANASGSATGSGIVILNGGTLGGSGIIAGNVLPGAGPHKIYPGAGTPGGSATLQIGSVTTNSDTTLAFNLITPGTSSINDVISISTPGGLNLNGGTTQIANTNTGAASLGYYRIIQYTGSIQGAGPSSLTLPAVQSNIAYTLDTTHAPGFIDLHRGFLGDANDDGTVDAQDFDALAAHFGQSGQSWSSGDFNGDGTVDFADFAILSNNFGTTLAASEIATLPSAPTPEPATLLLLTPLALLLPRRRSPRVEQKSDAVA